MRGRFSFDNSKNVKNDQPWRPGPFHAPNRLFEGT
jgi:hypothetical protein